VAGDIDVIGDDPLADGMTLSLRLRRDFTVTGAGRLLAAARRAYGERNPGTSADEAREAVSGAADALYVLLEHAGVLDDVTADGLTIGGWRAQVVLNEPDPLSPFPRSDCLRGDIDVFALPPGDAA
jgi:hypothetical protein